MPEVRTNSDAIRFYLTGAASDGASQRDPMASLGGYASSAEVESMGWRSADPMIGLSIMRIGTGVDLGAASIAALDADTLTFTANGDTTGAAVAIAFGEEKILESGTNGQFVHVKRFSDIPLDGAHAYTIVDRFNNVIGGANIPDADATAGVTDYRAIMIKNVSALSVSNVYVWIGAGDATIEVAKETPVSQAIQTIADSETAPTGLTWNTGTTSGTGLNIGTLAAGEMAGIWIKRIIAADTAASPSVLTELLAQFDYDSATYNTGLRGRFRVARGTEIDGAEWPGIVEFGIWVGQDAEPDLTAAADETWTTAEHTTSLSLAADHTYYTVIRQKNKYGLWSANTQSTVTIVAGDGSESPTPPSAPTDIVITTNADDQPRVTGLYEPAVDGVYRGEIFVIWFTTDDTAPDPGDTPSGYLPMGTRDGVEVLLWDATGVTALDGTPLKALVRTRRLRALEGDVFTPDTTQLPASGGGTIVVSEELADWDATGYARIDDEYGNLLEVIEYASLVVGSGISTFTVNSGGRALWGTTEQATTDTCVITPIEAIDSTNTDVTSTTMDFLPPVRPKDAAAFIARGPEQDLGPVSGPDGVTPIVIDAGENVYFLQGEGWTEFWIDTVLVWKVFCDTNLATAPTIYIPSEWDLVFTDPISGAAPDTDGIDVQSGTTIYIVVRGERRMLIDVTNMEIESDAFTALDDLVDTESQDAVWPQWAQTVFTVWDPRIEEYVDYLSLQYDGTLKAQFDVDNTLNQAAVEAL